ncbi:MAG TPA: glutamine synthetase [Pseudonocardiaceae bacterium]
MARAELVAAPPERLVLLLPDPHARFAAVELSGEFVADTVLDAGYGACTYLLAWDVERAAVDVPALERFLGGYGDLVLRPDLAALRPPYVVCDAWWPDGRPVDVAPRTVLRAALAAAEELGLVPSVGIEHEFVVTDAAGSPLTGHGLDYALGGTERLAPLLDDLRVALRGFGVESARGECHPGQYEIVPRHRDALAACDDALLVQHLVRATAHRHGARATYLAAPATGQGNSGHVHLSLSAVDGGPLGGTGREPSAVLAAFLAGVLRAAGDLTAVFAPTVNSYVRLRTSPFSPRLVRWGVDDRTAAVRLAGRDESLRLECRFAGADAQPHLVVAAILAAGLAGVRERATPPPPGEVVDELAATPWRALERWASGRPAALLGEAVVAHQAALLAAELDAACDAVTDWQRHRAALRT